MSDEIDWQTYVAESLKTSPDDVPRLTLNEFRLLHAACGLNSEVREYRDASTTDDREDEASDICWYMAVACKGLADLDGPDLISRHPEVWPMEGNVGFGVPAADRFAGAAESVACQRADIDEYADEMAYCLGAMAAMLLRDSDIDLEAVWRRNVEKLRNRHGDSFSPVDEQDR